MSLLPDNREEVAASLSFSISLLMARSFSIKSIRHRKIGLGLVIIVIEDKILDRILREELFHFAIKLGRKGLVVTENQGGFLNFLDHIGHGKSLPRSRYTQERLVGTPERIPSVS